MTASEPVEREYVTDSGFVRRLAWASVETVLLTRTRVVTLAIFTVGASAAMVYITEHPQLILLPVIYLGIYALLALVSYLAAFVSGTRTIPVGSRYTATMLAQTLVVGSPKISAEVPYASYGRVRRAGEFVAFNLSGMRTTTLLPACLFPDGDFDRLVEAVVSRRAPESSPEDLVRTFDHVYIADAGHPRRWAWALYKWLWTGNPIGLVILALVAVLTITVTITSGEWVLLTALIFVLSLGLAAIGAYFSVWRLYRRVAPPGTVYGLRFGETALQIRAPFSRTQLDYSWFRSVARRKGFVTLRARQGLGVIFLPTQLFPGEELERLAALIAHS